MMKHVHLLQYRVFADLKVEISRTYLGVLWWFVEPILYMTVFYFVFSTFRENAGTDFIVFLLIGLVPWKWFSTSITRSSKSISSHMNLFRNIYVNKFIFVLTPILSNTIKFLLVLLILLIFIVITGTPIKESWLLLPVLIFLQLFLIISCGLIVSSLLPIIPDLRLVVENGLLMMFFMSGVFFDVSNISGGAKAVFELNPMLFLLSSYRDVLQKGIGVDWGAYFGFFTLSMVFFAVGILLLRFFDKKYPKIFIG